MLKLSESQIEELILCYLNLKRRIRAWKNPTSGYFNPTRKIFVKHKSKFVRNGRPDIEGFFNEKVLFIEVKTPEQYRYIMKHYEVLKNYLGDCDKKNHLKAQIEFIEEANAHKQIAFFADSVECVEREMTTRG